MVGPRETRSPGSAEIVGGQSLATCPPIARSDWVPGEGSVCGSTPCGETKGTASRRSLDISALPESLLLFVLQPSSDSPRRHPPTWRTGSPSGPSSFQARRVATISAVTSPSPRASRKGTMSVRRPRSGSPLRGGWEGMDRAGVVKGVDQRSMASMRSFGVAQRGYRPHTSGYSAAPGVELAPAKVRWWPPSPSPSRRPRSEWRGWDSAARAGRGHILHAAFAAARAAHHPAIQRYTRPGWQAAQVQHDADLVEQVLIQ